MSRAPVARMTPAEEAAFRARYDEAKARSALLDTRSRAQLFAELPEEMRAEILGSLSVLDKARLFWSWGWWGRPKQQIPDDGHRIFLMLAGRGFGKSRTAAERIRERIYRGAQLLAFVGPTLKDIHRYMIGGAFAKAGKGSGILDVFPPHQRPVYKEQKGEIHFHTGAVAYIVTAEVPEWRGGNVDTVWADEPMKWEPKAREAIWDNMELSLRSDCGLPVEVVVSATPTPHPWLRKLIADPDCTTLIAETDENASNLEPEFIARLERKFGDSRKGRQERRAEILVDIEGAMFSQTIIDATRFVRLPDLRAPWKDAHDPRGRLRGPTAVAIDAAISTRRNVDATAIVGGSRGVDDDLYIREARAGKWDPSEWPHHVFDMAERLGTRRIVVERNRGGDILVGILRLVAKERERKTGRVVAWDYVEVIAHEGKRARADEVATLHEQGRVHFPPDPIVALEDEITTWDPDGGGPSPNLLDAFAWLSHDLYEGFAEDAAEVAAKRVEEVRRSFDGLTEAQKRMPAPAFRGNRV